MAENRMFVFFAGIGLIITMFFLNEPITIDRFVAYTLGMFICSLFFLRI